MSHQTAITRKEASAPARWLHENGYLKGRKLDYGCGKGADAEEFGMEKYDPHYEPDMPPGLFDTIICVYVLNVTIKADQEAILDGIEAKLVPGGTAYIAVRRDIPKEGKPGRGVVQRYVDLDGIAEELHNQSGRFSIYSWTHDLQHLVEVTGSKGDTYLVRVSPSGTPIACSCKGYLYHKHEKGLSCKHMARLKA